MLVKIYYPSQQSPLGRRMTVGFSELTINDTIKIKVPIGHFIWLGDGMALLHNEKQHGRQIGMICAGSGITPILQTCGLFVDINRDVEDIPCKDELDEFAKEYSARLSLHYSLTSKSIPMDWSHSVGRLDMKMMI
ncbi:hypothetical protein DXG01_005952, partial [Tephrocybe rancida]